MEERIYVFLAATSGLARAYCPASKIGPGSPALGRASPQIVQYWIETRRGDVRICFQIPVPIEQRRRRYRAVVASETTRFLVDQPTNAAQFARKFGVVPSPRPRKRTNELISQFGQRLLPLRASAD